MLGLILLYFIGKWHAELAFKHERKRWVYAILGIVTYYAGTMIFGFTFGIILAATNNMSWLETGMNEILVSFMALPFGILATVIQYYALKRHWEKNPKVIVNGELLDSTVTRSRTDEL